MVYASAQSHSSVEKAALLAGFGKQHVRIVPHEGSYAMRPESLDAMIQADLDAGRRPCAVVATTGTTTSTALDPLAAIGQVAKARGLWMHVDAAMAGSAMILPECRWMWQGVEQADSLIVNAHKWLGAVFDCTLYFVRDPEHLVRVMSTNPSYLQSAADGRVKNYRDWGLPLGRRFRALKLWFLIREQGVEALQERLRRDIANAQWLAGEVGKTPDWKVVAPAPLQTVCVRHEPNGLTGDALDKHTLDWVARLNQSGQAYVTPALLDGQWIVRVSIGAELTEREHVAQLWKLMQQAVTGQDSAEQELVCVRSERCSLNAESLTARGHHERLSTSSIPLPAPCSIARPTPAPAKPGRRSTSVAAFASWKAKTAFERVNGSAQVVRADPEG